MITGLVDASLQPLVRLQVRDAVGREQEVEALIDTGFTGSLTLPPPIVALFGLIWLGRQGAKPAGAVPVFLDVYAGIVWWDGQWRTIEIEAIEGIPLVGMDLLQKYERASRQCEEGSSRSRPSREGEIRSEEEASVR